MFSNLIEPASRRNKFGHSGQLRLTAATALAWVALWTGCGGSGSAGGGNPPPPPPPQNPVPAIVSLNPNTASAGGAAFSLTISGQNFVSSSSVSWNGSPRTTTFTSSSQLQAQITASDIANAASANVSVTNPSPGGGNSGAAEFDVTATSNPAPDLGSLNPASVNAGSGDFLLTVTGNNFIPAATILWNGSAVSTTFLSASQLQAEIPGAAVFTSGFADVSVANPSPGGGVSSPLVFSIAYAAAVVSQPANDLAWDATHEVIYLSVPSLGGVNGNSISVLNPLTGAIQSSVFAGSEPDRLAIDDADQYLYAGVDGASAVQRFILPELSPDVTYLLGADSFLGPYFGFDLQVAPKLPHTTAVSRGVYLYGGGGGGIEIFDDGIARAKVAKSGYDSLQWGNDATVYSNNNENTNFDIYVLDVNSNGVTLAKDYPNDFSTFYAAIHYDSGTKLLYTDDGYAINPTTGLHVGAFQASGWMIPDSTLNSAFFLGQTASQFGTPDFTIESFNLTTYQPVAEVVIANVQGTPLHFIRWGPNGLAFNDNAGYVYILNSPFAAAGGKRVITPARYMSPVVRGRRNTKPIVPVNLIQGSKISRRFTKARPLAATVPNPAPTATSLTPSTALAGDQGFTLTVTGSNFVSLSTIEWNGNQLQTELVSGTQLQANVSASDVAAPGSAVVTVVTPGPGGGTSASLPFTIISNSANPIPVLISLYPDYAPAGSAGFTMNVNGLTYFNTSSIVEWNGSPRPATLYGPGQLQVQINASDLATPGFGQVTVTNPGPGGGTSNVLAFQILYEPTIVKQTTNDMVWDPLNQVMYISVPGSASTNANQVCVLNPATLAIGNCQPGNEPDVLAISDDSQFLYAGMDGTGTVQRYILPALTPDVSYSLGNYEPSVPYFALDLQVAPSAPHTTAVSLGVMNLDPAAQGGVAVFDDVTERPAIAAGGFQLYDSIQWGSDSTAIYAANSESTSFDFYTLGVSSSGVVLDQDYSGDFWNPGRIHYDTGSGLVYSDDGYHAINPSTGLPAGIFEVGGGWPMAPDSTLNTVFILDKYIFQENSNYTIQMFDMTHYVPVSRIPFSTTQNGIGRLGRFIRWGATGLALNDMQGNLYLISTTNIVAPSPRIFPKP